VAAPWIVDDGVWELVAPLLPSWPTRAPGPRPVDDRRCLQPILVVLHTGIGGEDLPAELGFGAGMTCWRRLRRWSEAGVFAKLPRVLLAELHAAGALDWSRTIADAAHLRANKGAPGSGRPRSTGAARARSTT
jgi:transposase